MLGRLKRIAGFHLMLYRYTNGLTKIYHTGINKSKRKIFKELYKWLYREKSFNSMYYAFGLNIAGTEQNQYIGRNEILHHKNLVENKFKRDANNQLNYDVITKDKFYANSILTANGINCIKNIAVIHNSKMLFNDGSVKSLDAILNFEYPFFVKNTVLEAGEGVISCIVDGEQIEVNGNRQTINEFKNKLGENIWVIQTKHKAHEEIRKINDSALNTTRIVTIINGKDPVYLTGFQSFAIGNEVTDSWSKGSIYVGIEPRNNCLKKFGYYNPWIKDKSLVEKHPDSGIVFDGYKISELQYAVELCIRAHQILFFNFIIGWDVAITDNGPMILEANEKPGMNAVQCVDGGLRYQIKKYTANCLTRELKIVLNKKVQKTN